MCGFGFFIFDLVESVLVGIFYGMVWDMHSLLECPRVQDRLLGVCNHYFLISNLKMQLSSHRGYIL